MPEQRLLVGSIGYRAAGWWAILGGILTEAALFVFLLFSYYYLAIQPHSGAWLPGGPPSLKLSLPNTFILLASSVAVWWGEWGTKRGNRPMQIAGLLGRARARRHLRRGSVLRMAEQAIPN